MLIVCYGIHKTASTFTWQLIREYFSLFTKMEVTSPNAVFQCTRHNLAEFEEIIRDDSHAVILKTHGRLTPFLQKLSAENCCFATANFRDPRDVTLSMLDAGEVERNSGKNNVMSQILNIDNAIEKVLIEYEVFEKWAEEDFRQKVEYEEICFNTKPTLKKLLSPMLGHPPSDSEIDSVVEAFSDRRNIKFNKGVPNRYTLEMNEEQAERCNEKFKEILNKYF